MTLTSYISYAFLMGISSYLWLKSETNVEHSVITDRVEETITLSPGLAIVYTVSYKITKAVIDLGVINDMGVHIEHPAISDHIIRSDKEVDYG